MMRSRCVHHVFWMRDKWGSRIDIKYNLVGYPATDTPFGRPTKSEEEDAPKRVETVSRYIRWD